MSHQEELDVLDRLKRIRDEIDALIDLIDDKRRLFGSEKERAQMMLKELKGNLRAEYKRGDTVKGRAQMTEAERRFYHPAVHEAYIHISVRINSVPDQKWYSDLYDAQIDIEFYLSQLEKR